MFGDYAYVGRGDSAGRGNGNVQYKGLGSGSDPVKGQNSFEVRRIYLGFNYYVNEKFSAVILLDYNGSARWKRGQNIVPEKRLPRLEKHF